ncbi:MAG: FliM/FliN family flagellar motor switch protein [Candidatus Altiarchaeota archaeon]
MTENNEIKKKPSIPPKKVVEPDPYLSELDSSIEELDKTPARKVSEDDGLGKTVITKQPDLGEDLDINEPLSKNLLDLAPDIEVSLVAIIGKKTLSVKDLLLMRTGQVVEMERDLHEAIDLVVGGKVLARGELVDVEGRIGVKVLEVMTP